MRLFLGLDLDEPVRAAAADAAERLRRTMDSAAPDLDARWVAPANLHITVWFLGEVADDRVPAIADALTIPPFAAPAFDLALAGCGAFPPSGPPRVFWIGVREGTDAARRVYEGAGERLVPLGFPAEKRRYTPHLTIARVKDPGRSGRSAREVLAAEPADCGTMRVEAVTLFRSRLSPRGAAYEPLLRVPLS